MKITLPRSKYTLELKDFLSSRVAREYQKMLLKDTDVSSKSSVTGEVEVKIKMDRIYEAQDFALKELIVSLSDEQGAVVPNPFEALQELSAEDGQTVYNKLQELIDASGLGSDLKKNG